MAGQVNWDELLKYRFPTYKVEEDAFIDSLEVANSTEVYIERIYEAIRNDESVHIHLKMMYREAIHGENKDVLKRIKNRISNIRRNCRSVFLSFLQLLNINGKSCFIKTATCDSFRCHMRVHAFFITFIKSAYSYSLGKNPILYSIFRFNPKIKEINMIHAFDCSKLSLRDLQDKIKDAKKKDERLRKTIQ